MNRNIEEDFQHLMEPPEPPEKLSDKEIFFAASAFMFHRVIEIYSLSISKTDMGKKMRVVANELNNYFREELESKEKHGTPH